MMYLVMTELAYRHSFPIPCNHWYLPLFFSCLDITHFPDVMHFKFFFTATKFTLTCLKSINKAGHAIGVSDFGQFVWEVSFTKIDEEPVAPVGAGPMTSVLDNHH